MTVSEFLSDCGQCPECGNPVEMNAYDPGADLNTLIYGTCSSEFCNSEWKWTLRTEEV